MSDSLEMYFYERSGGTATTTVAAVSTSYAAKVTPTTGKRLVLMGFTITPSAANVLMTIAYGAGTTVLSEVLAGGVVVPITVDMRECPPIGAVNQALQVKIATGTAKITAHTMEMD